MTGERDKRKVPGMFYYLRDFSPNIMEFQCATYILMMHKPYTYDA